MPPPMRLKPIPLFEPNWSSELLRQRYEREPRSFERGFRMRAFSDEESSFPSYASCLVPGVTVGELQRSDWIKVTGVDLSSKKRPGNAIVTVAVNPVRRHRYVVDVRYGAWKSNETCEQLNDVNAQLNPIAFMVEDNAYQAALIEWAQAFPDRYPWWMKVEPTTTTSGSKTNADLGLPVLQTEFKSKSWIFPAGEFEGRTTNDPPPGGHWARLDYEIRNHPLCATSDGVMALWFARQGIEIFANERQYSADVGDVNVR